MSAKSIKHQITVKYNGIIYNKVYCEWYYGNGGDIITDANLIAELELARRICNNIIPTGTFTGGGGGGNQDLQSVTDIGNTTTNTIVHAPAINDDESATLGQVKSNVEEEATLRISNDAVLNNKIETETQDRITADNTLTSSITEESDARQLADEALDAKLQEFMTKSDNEDAIIRTRLDDIEEQLPVVGQDAIKTNPGSTIVSLAIDPSDNVLTQSTSGLKTNISIVKTSSAYVLTGNNGANLGEIAIVDNNFLEEVTYDPSTHILRFVFNTETGQETIDVDLSSMVVTYTGSQYITVGTDNVISLNYAALKSTLDAVYAPINHTHSYNDLTNKPSIPAAQINSDWNAIGTVAEILNKPILARVATTGSYTDLTNKPTIPAAQIQSDWNQTSTTDVDYIKNKPVLARVATTGSYNDLLNRPTITAPVNADWNSTSGLSQILNKPTLSAVAISGSYNDLINRPSYLPNQYSLNIQLNGNAQPSYNGSAERTINITPASIGAATVVSLGDYVKKSGDTMTGILTLPNRLNFQGIGTNYISVPENQAFSIGFGPLTGTYIPLVVKQTEIFPNTANFVTLGSSARRWSTVYSVDGDFSNSIKVGSLTLSTNYISGANSIGIVPSGLSVSSANAPLMVNANTGQGVYPGTNNKWSSGIAAQRWSNVYSVNGNFTGTVTAPTFIGALQGNADSSTRINLTLFADANNSIQPLAGVYGTATSTTTNYPAGESAGGTGIRMQRSTANVVSNSQVLLDFFTSVANNENIYVRKSLGNGTAVQYGTWYRLLHTGNFNSIADASYVKKSGDTMTGDLTAPTFIGALQGNASTATTLQTARTIFGQNFNGSQNVTGALTGVTNITASGTITSSKVQASSAPVANNDLTNKQYVDSLVGSIGNSYVLKSGDIMTGALTTPSINLTSNSGQMITMSGASYNYISATRAGSSIVFGVNGGTNVAEMNWTGIMPFEDNDYALGAVGLRWSTIYGVFGYFSGDLNVTGNIVANTVSKSSDIRLKSNIQNVDTSAIKNITFKQFIKNGKNEYGVIAQEVVKHIPDSVTESSDGILSVDYTSILSAKCAQYEEEIENLREELLEIKALLINK